MIVIVAVLTIGLLAFITTLAIQVWFLFIQSHYPAWWTIPGWIAGLVIIIITIIPAGVWGIITLLRNIK